MSNSHNKAPKPQKGDATLSKLAEDVLASCSDALLSAGDLTADQIERIMDIAKLAKKPKAVDVQAILEEEGDLA